MIGGTLAMDSTLLTTVGEANKPATAGNGGRKRGCPRRVEQRGFLTADVGTGAGVHDEIEVVSGAEDVVAEVPGGVRVGDSGLQPPQYRNGLTAEVHERVPRADRVGRDDRSFEEGVWSGEQERDVLAGSGLGFVGVDDEVVGLVVTLRNERPLGAGGEPRAPTPAQARVLDRRHHGVGFHAEGDRQRLVSVLTAVGVESPRLVVIPGPREHGRQSRPHVPEIAVGAGVTVAWRRRGGHTAIASDAQTGQRGATCGAAGFERAVAFVGESGEQPGGVAERRERGAAGGLRRPPRTEVADEVDRGLHGRVVEQFPVDGHRGGEIAGGVAFDVLERDRTVLGGLAVGDAEMIPHRFEDLVTAHDRAERVRAHSDVIGAGGLAPVHGVESGNRSDLRAGQSQLPGAEFESCGRDVAVLGLDEVQQRKQGGAAVGVAADDLGGILLEPGEHVVGIAPACTGAHDRGVFLRSRPERKEDRFLPSGRNGCVSLVDVFGAHRSTPPITGSMLASEAITSETMPPSHIAATAWRFVNDGSR